MQSALIPLSGLGQLRQRAPDLQRGLGSGVVAFERQPQIIQRTVKLLALEVLAQVADLARIGEHFSGAAIAVVEFDPAQLFYQTREALHSCKGKVQQSVAVALVVEVNTELTVRTVRKIVIDAVEHHQSVQTPGAQDVQVGRTPFRECRIREGLLLICKLG